MANHLLTARSASLVGKNWPENFVQRTPEVKTKYGIAEEDIYNFDETGFQMGVISGGKVVTGSDRRNRRKAVQPGNREWVTVIQGINAKGWAIPPFIIFAGTYHLSAWYEGNDIPPDWVILLSDNGWTNNELGIKWLQHFDKHTKGRTVGVHRLLIIDGHESHDSLEFQQLCKEKSIITLCMPSHSSHLLQPLDVGCFSPLKDAYGRQVEDLIRNHIYHVTKLEFLPAFKAAYQATFTESNIRAGF
ncbi:CENP-B protein [Zopfia rhizophila CBS 207.26]|uniref:CENP-B protein n=1 Tax=Zopfia rhizophila CBS 207.26 TaxID=1314779 RepID=A0A6A6DDB1_9PEZI|nr:CENP-B protein [Zopfia rhizophila CBS 207.26]